MENLAGLTWRRGGGLELDTCLIYYLPCNLPPCVCMPAVKEENILIMGGRTPLFPPTPPASLPGTPTTSGSHLLPEDRGGGTGLRQDTLAWLLACMLALSLSHVLFIVSQQGRNMACMWHVACHCVSTGFPACPPSNTAYEEGDTKNCFLLLTSLLSSCLPSRWISGRRRPLL